MANRKSKSSSKSKPKGIGASMAASGVGILCMNPPPPKGLDERQLAALHVCKHEMLAALFRLYMEVPPVEADKVLGRYLTIKGATK